MIKRATINGVFILLLIVSLFSIVSAASSEITIKVSSKDYKISARVIKPGTTTFIDSFHKYPEPTGILVQGISTLEEEFEIDLRLLFNGEEIYREIYGPYITGEPVTIDLTNSKEESEPEPVVEPEVTETTTEEVTIVEDTTTDSEKTDKEDGILITGLAVAKDKFGIKNIIYAGIGIIVLAIALTLLFMRKKIFKPSSKVEPTTPQKEQPSSIKLSELKQQQTEGKKQMSEAEELKDAESRLQQAQESMRQARKELEEIKNKDDKITVAQKRFEQAKAELERAKAEQQSQKQIQQNPPQPNRTQPSSNQNNQNQN